MAAPSTKSGTQRSTGDVVNEIWGLTRDYAKQETIDPLKSIGKFLARGIPGALLLGLGGFFIGLGIIRLLQDETGQHLTGSWNWVPYAVGLVFTVIAAGLAARSITKPSRSPRDRA